MTMTEKGSTCVPYLRRNAPEERGRCRLQVLLRDRGRVGGHDGTDADGEWPLAFHTILNTLSQIYKMSEFEPIVILNSQAEPDWAETNSDKRV